MSDRILKIVDRLPKDILVTRWPNPESKDEIQRVVDLIVQSVRKQGDEALIRFTSKFDGVKLDAENIRVDQSEIDDAYPKVTKNQVEALKESIDRLKVISESLLERLAFGVSFKGLRVDVRTSPISAVGCYVPGGTAKYPSSVLMCAVPAMVAGVERTVVCTPPNEKAKINPLTLVACDLCGVEEIYRIGGAQAIAAMAYGTESITPVMKIVGPGNKYVTMAKRLVSRDVPIDVPAGPSELVILADGTANPRFVALDLISQAEHDIDAKVILVTGNRKLAEEVASIIEDLCAQVSRKEYVKRSLEENGLIFVYDSLDDGIAFINQYAPEHLTIISDCASKIRRRITSAGLVLIGQSSPVAASDYMLGVNHVLPTGGYSKAYSGLSVLDFVKVINEVSCTRSGLALAGPSAALLAEFEGLSNHATAIQGRLTE